MQFKKILRLLFGFFHGGCTQNSPDAKETFYNIPASPDGYRETCRVSIIVVYPLMSLIISDVPVIGFGVVIVIVNTVPTVEAVIAVSPILTVPFIGAATVSVFVTVKIKLESIVVAGVESHLIVTVSVVPTADLQAIFQQLLYLQSHLSPLPLSPLGARPPPELEV